MGEGDWRSVSGLTLNVMDPAPVGVAVTSGREHRLVYSNLAIQEILGERPLGVPAREAFVDVAQRGYFSLLDQVLETGEPMTLRELPFEYRGRTGHERWGSVRLSKVSLGPDEEGVLLVALEATGEPDCAEALDAEGRRRFLQRYQSLLQVETQAVWVTGPMGEVSEPSPGWQRMTGQTWEEYRGEGWMLAVHPEDRPSLRQGWARAMQRQGHWEQVYRLRMADGAYRHVRSRGVPVIEAGAVVEWVGTATDIEQEWQEERRARLLEQAAAATADIANLEEVLRLLTHVIVPSVLDGCGIYLIPEYEGTPPTPFTAERFLSIVRDGLPREPQPRLEQYDANSDFVEAVRSRRPVHRVFPVGEPPPGAAPTGAEEFFRASGANSMALIPVIVDGAVAAVLDAVICGSREPIGPADVDLLGRMLDHAHAHLSNAMRFQRTQRVALALQHYLLTDPPDVPGMEITVRYRPSVATAEIGGDWYDCFVLPDGATILTIGDVAGHDLTAAVTMSQLRNMLRGLAVDRREPPGDILRRLNVATESLYHEGTATCVLGRLEGPSEEGWRLDYSSAGHPPPLLVTLDGQARFLEDGANPLLGITYDRPRTSARLTLPPGSTLLFYTDGLVEIPGEHLDDGLERLRRHAVALAGAPLDEFCDKLLARVPGARKDDIAMIAVRLPENCGRR